MNRPRWEYEARGFTIRESTVMYLVLVLPTLLVVGENELWSDWRVFGVTLLGGCVAGALTIIAEWRIEKLGRYVMTRSPTLEGIKTWFRRDFYLVNLGVALLGCLDIIFLDMASPNKLWWSIPATAVVVALNAIAAVAGRDKRS